MRTADERTAELRHDATHDALTGLANRAMIIARIDELLESNRSAGTSCSTLYVDLDDFKNVKYTLGHQAGDHLLVSIARRLQVVLGEADSVGRMGGDEFVVLLDGSRAQIAPEMVAERLLGVLSRPFHIADIDPALTVSASIGIASGDRARGGDLLRDADVALHRAKAEGKSRYRSFRPAMQTAISRRVDLEHGLRSALPTHQFRLLYQPIYRADDLTVVTAEALLRWDRPTLGPVDPAEFIPVLEQSGQIGLVGRWVLSEACRDASRGQLASGLAQVSVNVSARQLDDDAIVADIAAALAQSGLAASALTIEVTEMAIMHDTGYTVRRLRAIRDLGVRIAVDDFGTGSSSLAYLREFPVDVLEIDRHFVSAIGGSAAARALIRTFVRLSQDLALEAVAEGVETMEQLQLLRDEGVDLLQGYYLCTPVSPGELTGEVAALSRPRISAA